jgi:hypothetical protein
MQVVLRVFVLDDDFGIEYCAPKSRINFNLRNGLNVAI